MLNISDNPIPSQQYTSYSTYRQVSQHTGRKLARWLLVFFILFIIILMLPWTQNVRSKGKLTTLDPANRPQSIYATIGGRIEQWYVREGDLVKRGDTIAHLTEVKVDYFDPQLIDRTQQQVDAKQAAVQSYDGKASALQQQVAALIQSRDFKISQTQNKIQQYRLKIASDSADWIAAKLDAEIAEYQYKRTDSLYKKGIKSLTDLEEKRRKMQETQAKRFGYENKVATSRAELTNAQIELNSIATDYADKIAKSTSDRYSTLSDKYDAESTVAKLQSQYNSYNVRAQYYYIVAPQDGYITKILKKGLGEIVKENEELLTIVPDAKDLAVEMYIKPMDYPLLQKGQKVRFIFDGWPAFVFSGWEGMSFGTFGGVVTSIDNMTSDNGMYRIFVAPDTSAGKMWPPALRVGSAADGMIMLNDVPLWYELWRQLNGFPADFYDEASFEKVKLKAPANQFKK